ncbi:MAG: hypothetical protein ACJ744_03210 [Gaiellaceae bacterium]
MRKSLLIISALAALVVAGASSGAPAKPISPLPFVVGATEDQVLGFDDGGAAIYTQMTSHLLGAIRVSVDYEPSEPTTVQQKEQLSRAIDTAKDKNMRVILGIQPGHSTDVTGDPNGVKKFAAYTALVAKAFPSVNDIVVGNEPNLGRFWFPTFNANGTIASAGTYEAALAASYDALKAVRPEIDVIGIAVSPKGDDRPGSARNTISPVRFIKAVGDAYRRSGRKKPIMDNVALHPYPFVNTDPPDKGAPWPQVSVANLDRAEQAFWDGFNGTAQPTFEEAGVQRAQSGAPVKWLLDEAGWQTDTRGMAGYFGSENTPTIDEATQAQYYRQVIQRYACDNHVAALLFFHWIDEADRDRLQSGLTRANRALKPAANAVRDAIATGCPAGPVLWKHSAKVDGASSTWKPKNGNLFAVKAFEDATFVATATPTKAAALRAKRLHQKLRAVKVKGKIKAYTQTGVKFKGIKYANSRTYTYSVKITSSLNAKRSVTLKTKKIKKPDTEL